MLSGRIQNICKHTTKKLLDYDEMFPDIYTLHIKEEHKYNTAGDYIRKSYRGGWCYLVKGKENKVYENGTTADVNSLYPSMMHSESGNKYPVGKPKFWIGNFIPPEAIAENKYYFVRIKTRFYIKKNMLPFIQIKGSFYTREQKHWKHLIFMIKILINIIHFTEIVMVICAILE